MYMYIRVHPSLHTPSILQPNNTKFYMLVLVGGGTQMYADQLEPCSPPPPPAPPPPPDCSSSITMHICLHCM